MTTIVWVTGRAGVGKSTVTAACLARLAECGQIAAQLCDEELMLRMKCEDTGHRHHYHPYRDERFLFRNGYLFDEGLRRINKTLQAMLHAGFPDLVFVEMARGTVNPLVDVSWARALQLIDPVVWTSSLVFRLEAPFGVQLIRNRQRGSGGGRMTPEKVLTALYAADPHGCTAAAGITLHPIPSRLSPKEAADIVLDQLEAFRAPGKARQGRG